MATTDRAAAGGGLGLGLAACTALVVGNMVYGAGAETVFLGFLLILAGIPVHVAIKWRNRNDIREET